LVRFKSRSGTGSGPITSSSGSVSGSGSCKKFRILADPDPQHWDPAHLYAHYFSLHIHVLTSNLTTGLWIRIRNPIASEFNRVCGSGSNAMKEEIVKEKSMLDM
jgi:hypothetical protein